MLQHHLLNIPFAILIGFSILFTGCGTDSGGSGMGTMTVEMGDAPIDSADAVNVFIERVEVNRDGESNGWTTLNEPQQSYDLLELTNGATEVIGTAELDAGTYSQIRLILSQDGHSVLVDGSEYDMLVPSGAQTGIKLNVNADIQEDIEYVILLDFDASRSVREAGQNNPAVQYLLQPVIKATNKAITGNIDGTVDPAEARPVVYAIAGTDTLASTIADTTDGYFKLIGLEEGSYDVSIEPRSEDYQAATEEDVSVTVEETTNLGTIPLN